MNMYFDDEDVNAPVPEGNMDVWSNIFGGTNIPVPVEEFTTPTFCGFSSLSPSDANSTNASYHSDSSGYQEAPIQNIATNGPGMAKTEYNCGTQMEASVKCVRQELLSAGCPNRTNTTSGSRNSYSCHTLSQNQSPQWFQEEGNLRKSSNEFHQTSELSMYSGGFDELAKTIAENCSVADLMDLSLDNNLFSRENGQVVSDVLSNEFGMSTEPSELSSFHRHPDSHHLIALHQSHALSHDLTNQIPDTCGDSSLWDCTKEISSAQAGVSKNVPTQNHSKQASSLSSYFTNYYSSGHSNKSNIGSQNIPTEPDESNCRIFSSSNQPQNNISKESKSSPHLVSSNISANRGLDSSSHLTNRIITQQRSSSHENSKKSMETNTPLSENSERFLMDTNTSDQPTVSQAEVCQETLGRKTPVMKFKRVPGSKEFYITSASAAQIANSPTTSDSGINSPSDDYDQPQDRATSSSSNVASAEMDFEESLSVSPLAARPSSKICGVCGDVAKSMHFGGMACDSCKAFFRRSVQGKYWKKFRCSINKTCKIAKSNRRSCQFCRFAKCRKNGMKISWVMTEEERLVLWKKRLTKHKQDESDEDMDSLLTAVNRYSYVNRKYSEGDNSYACEEDFKIFSKKSTETEEEHHLRHRNKKNSICGCDKPKLRKELHPWPSPLPTFLVALAGESRFVPDTSIYGTSIRTRSEDHPLSSNDCQEINRLLEIQNNVFSSNRFTKACEGNTVEAAYNVYVNVCEKLCSFYRANEDLHLLTKADRRLICRSGFLASLLFHSVYNYDEETKSWPRDSCMDAIKVPYQTVDTVAKFAKSTYAAERLLNFSAKYHQDIRDEGVLAILLILTVVHDIDSPHELENEMIVAKCKEKYLHLLIRYLRFRQGERGYLVTLPRLLTAISEAKKLSSLHRMSQFDIASSIVHSKNAIKTVQLIKDMTDHPLPKFSSVMTSVEEDKYTMRSQGELHHPVTNAIFGLGTQTNALLVNPLEQMLDFRKENLLSIEHDPQKNTETCKLSPAGKTKRKAHDKQENVNSGTLTDKQDPHQKLDLGSDSTWSEEKRVGVQVLGEMLQYVAQSGNSEAMESLCRSLPPELIETLTGTSFKKPLAESGNEAS